MTDNNPLFDEPKLDEFKTESPLRAFASFDMFGNYLIAKGFRPSLGHLTRYLDAMEKKEGWQFVQLLEAATGVPTIIFRKAASPLETVEVSSYEPFTNEMLLRHFGTRGRIDEDKEKEARAHVSRLGLTLGGDEVAAHPLEAPFGESTLTIKGLDPEKVIWNRVQWRGEIEKLFDAARGRPHHIKVKDFLRRENVTDMRHYYRTASVASVLRLIDMFEGWDTYALDEYISDDALYTAIGRVNVKARAACKTDLYTAFANAIRESEVTSDDEELATYQPPINPVDVLEKAAEDMADDLGLEVDRESFAVAREHLEEMVPDCFSHAVPDDRKEAAARYVFERLVTNPKHRAAAMSSFKKSFLNPKGTPLPPHDKLDAQLQFIIGGGIDVTVVRNLLASFTMLERESKSASDSKVVEHIVYKAGERTVHEVNIESKSDDPLNPSHYNGRECADIGERLTPNGYQILKYCWRLGKKDDPCQELGKALWYLDSERNIISLSFGENTMVPNFAGIEAKDRLNYLLDRTANQSQFTADVARFLWNGYTWRDLDKLQAMIADHKAHLDCGHGLAI